MNGAVHDAQFQQPDGWARVRFRHETYGGASAAVGSHRSLSTLSKKE